MKRLTRQQKIAAAATTTRTWLDEVARILPTLGPLRHLWPAMVTHNRVLVDGADFEAAGEHRENCLYAFAHVADLEAAVAAQVWGESAAAACAWAAEEQSR